VSWVEVLGRYSKIAKPSNLCQTTTVRSVPVAAPKVHAVSRRLPAETLQQLVTDYQIGIPSTQLAKRYGISKGAALRLLRHQSIPIRNQPMTTLEIEQAIQLYRAGNSLAKVGITLGYDHGTIHQALKQAGVAMRDSHGRER
jgi:transposase-like protein